MLILRVHKNVNPEQCEFLENSENANFEKILTNSEIITWLNRSSYQIHQCNKYHCQPRQAHQFAIPVAWFRDP